MSHVKRPKTKRGRQTFQALLNAAEHQFYVLGYHGATIKDITSDAGVGLGTFYIYFNDKKSCYQYLLLQYSHYIRSQIAQKIEQAKDRREAERLGLLEFLEIVRDNASIYHIIWESLYIDKDLFIEYYTTFAQYYMRAIEANINTKGGYKDVDPEVLAYTLMGIANFIGLRYTMFDKSTDLEKIASQVIEMLDKGIFN
ncbi:MAG: TetR/AcrR family transcriptional regulator, partial [Erysipelothrix sp.]|nr:TetR/AcrR family transcriptional regulator [Erysipelothrix sp.]